MSQVSSVLQTHTPKYETESPCQFLAFSTLYSDVQKRVDELWTRQAEANYHEKKTTFMLPRHLSLNF